MDRRGKTIKTGLLITAAWLMIAAACAGCGTDRELVVGVEENFRPMSYSENGELKGFEVDLWKAIAEQEGLKYRFEPMPASKILQSLEHKKIDAGLAGFTINRERKKNLEFSTAYYTAGLRMVTRESDSGRISRPSDLRDKVVATRIGTTAYRYSSYLEGIREVRAYPDIEQAFEALEKGEADAVIFDGPVVRHYVAAHGKDGTIRTAGSTLTREQYGIVLQKGSRYTGRINNALRELGKNGTYEKLYVKWFGEKPDSVPGKPKS